MSASPERPSDDACGLNASLCETVCYAADFLDRPADEVGRFVADGGFVFLGIG